MDERKTAALQLNRYQHRAWNGRLPSQTLPGASCLAFWSTLLSWHLHHIYYKILRRIEFTFPILFLPHCLPVFVKVVSNEETSFLKFPNHSFSQVNSISMSANILLHKGVEPTSQVGSLALCSVAQRYQNKHQWKCRNSTHIRTTRTTVEHEIFFVFCF